MVPAVVVVLVQGYRSEVKAMSSLIPQLKTQLPRPLSRLSEFLVFQCIGRDELHHRVRFSFAYCSAVKQVTELDDVTAMALAGLEVSELFEDVGDQKHVYGLTKKFKLADRLRALEMLGRHMKMFTDKVEHTDKCVRPIQVDSGLDLTKLTKEELEELYRLCQIMEAEERKPGSAQDSAAKPRTRSLPVF